MKIRQLLIICFIPSFLLGCSDSQIAPLDTKNFRLSALEYFRELRLPAQIQQQASIQFSEENLEKTSREFCYNFTQEKIPKPIVAQFLADQYKNNSPQLTKVLIAIDLTFVQMRCKNHYPELLEAVQQNYTLQKKFQSLTPNNVQPPFPKKPPSKTLNKLPPELVLPLEQT